MGRPIPTDYDEELLCKLKILFQQACEKFADNPDRVPTYEEFVRELDVNDKTVKRIFEFLVKETSTERIRNSDNNNNNNNININNNNNISININNNNANNNQNNARNERFRSPLIHLFASPHVSAVMGPFSFGNGQNTNNLYLPGLFQPSSP